MDTRATTATTTRPNRVLIALAAAWMALALAIGGAVNAGGGASDSNAPTSLTESAER